jgi:hypothetical protein
MTTTSRKKAGAKLVFIAVKHLQYRGLKND